MEKVGILAVIDLSKEKLELTYPCVWNYKLIGLSEIGVRTAIGDVILEKPHKLLPSKVSRSGKFQSFDLELIVHCEDERIMIFESLRAHSEIKMVL